MVHNSSCLFLGEGFYFWGWRFFTPSFSTHPQKIKWFVPSVIDRWSILRKNKYYVARVNVQCILLEYIMNFLVQLCNCGMAICLFFTLGSHFVLEMVHFPLCFTVNDASPWTVQKMTYIISYIWFIILLKYTLI